MNLLEDLKTSETSETENIKIESTENTDIDKLRFVRIFTPMHIPKHLVEQVRDREYDIDEFYKYQEINCVSKSVDGFTLNPLNHLYVLVDENNNTKGFLWFTVDVLSKHIFIHTFSVDKEYWFKGKTVKKLADFVKDIQRKASLKKIYWCTSFPKHSQRHGFRRSSGILMEYTIVVN